MVAIRGNPKIAERIVITCLGRPWTGETGRTKGGETRRRPRCPARKLLFYVNPKGEKEAATLV